VISRLLYLSPTRKLLYVTDHSVSKQYPDRPSSQHIFEHLSCFLPGLLALGAHTLPLDDLDSELGITPYTLSQINYISGGKQHTTHLPLIETEYKKQLSYGLKQLHMWAAEGLAQTCYLTYADQVTGLGPDEMYMRTEALFGGGKVKGEGPTNGSRLWMDAMEEWKKERNNDTNLPPGTERKRPVTHNIDRDYIAKKSSYLLRPEVSP
jgi:endoplasmic reticulum Man9GlcNAc2 1,2-alpha-mannosidase